MLREFGTYDIYARDLAEEAYAFSANLDGLADGPYQVTAELSDRGSVLRRLVLNILSVRDLGAQEIAVEQRIAKVQGFDSTKATIRYPFDYARVINLGGRELIPGRNPEDSTTNAYFDFPAEIRNSFELLKSLEAGKDPLFRIKGEHARHYAFRDAFAVKVREFFQEPDILQQLRATWPCGHHILVVGDRTPGIGGKFLFVTHRAPLLACGSVCYS